MNKHKQNIAIALACGWKQGTVRRQVGKPEEIVNKDWSWTPPQGWIGSDSRFAKAYRNDREGGILTPPDYCESLEAMHEALLDLDWSGNKWNSYRNHLHAICKAGGQGDWFVWFVEHNATAKQRAEAFLKTLNLWEQ